MSSALIFKTKKHIYRDITGNIGPDYLITMVCYSLIGLRDELKRVTMLKRCLNRCIV